MSWVAAPPKHHPARLAVRTNREVIVSHTFPQVVTRFLGPLLLVSGPAAAQLRVVPDKPTCSTCRIDIGQRYLRLADSTAEVSGPGRFVSSWGRAGYVVGGPGVPFRFSSIGRAIGPIGRAGRGPREFTHGTAFAVGPGDSLAALDVSTSRISVYSSSAQYVRSFQVSLSTQNGGFAWLSDGTFALSGLIPRAESIGFTVHLYSSAGQFIKSLAIAKQPVTPATSQTQLTRLIRELPNRQLLTVTLVDSYTIQVWNLDSGRLVLELQREAPWFGQKKESLQTKMVGIHVDQAGRLWTLTPVISREWESGVVRNQIDGVAHGFRVIDPEKVIDSVIEVIDLRAGMVIARTLFEKRYPALLPGGFVAAEIVDSEIAGFDLFPLSLVQQPDSRGN